MKIIFAPLPCIVREKSAKPANHTEYRESLASNPAQRMAARAMARKLVDPIRFELTTSSMPLRRSSN